MDLKWFLFSFEGRINRMPFWIFCLVVSIIGLILKHFFDIDLIGKNFNKNSLIFSLIILWPALAVQAKRWHDRNKSAWWILINLVPIIGPIYALVQNGFLAGTKGQNIFGDDPLAGKKRIVTNRNLTRQELKILLALGISCIVFFFIFVFYWILTYSAE